MTTPNQQKFPVSGKSIVSTQTCFIPFLGFPLPIFSTLASSAFSPNFRHSPPLT
ncbi:hypothetical protein COCSADRAFT_309366 [Bipolaris sorokiniana ND90Pr]|uniref:Uncharacterized protein n=1 Tax=Cochliobolus sativus (strain ND90Pr / ATCC 201652) TaxID=665912 RepID=M2TA09_COCSN|nr:uncharacterized protein COCSADRAFT_309366 [Bipolaris sorokiniana ND90Pr]EMD65757.1 hypothetical protein COCSADRAFT_309366 [Bipolaris sorokiniana ND90Pr]